MKYLLYFMIAPFLITLECCNQNSKQQTTQDTTTTVVDQPPVQQPDTVTTSPEPIQQPPKDTVKNEGKSKLPDCISDFIKKSSKNAPADLPVQNDEYSYKGKKVYLYTAPCCDQFNVLYDDKCKVICSASGGITGRGDGKCPDFSKEGKFVKTVWKNPASK